MRLVSAGFELPEPLLDAGWGVLGNFKEKDNSALYRVQTNVGDCAIIKVPQPGCENLILAEIDAHRKVRSPQVVPMIASSTEWPFVVTPYIEGGDLSDLLLAPGRGTDGQLRHFSFVAYIIEEALIGVSALHSVGLTHRDLGPSNIMINFAAGVQLIDLGLCGARCPDSNTGYVGLPGFTAPTDPSSPTADIYSLAAVAFFLLSGKSYFDLSVDYKQVVEEQKQRDIVSDRWMFLNWFKFLLENFGIRDHAKSLNKIPELRRLLAEGSLLARLDLSRNIKTIKYRNSDDTFGLTGTVVSPSNVQIAA